MRRTSETCSTDGIVRSSSGGERNRCIQRTNDRWRRLQHPERLLQNSTLYRMPQSSSPLPLMEDDQSARSLHGGHAGCGIEGEQGPQVDDLDLDPLLRQRRCGMEADMDHGTPCDEADVPSTSDHGGGPKGMWPLPVESELD